MRTSNRGTSSSPCQPRAEGGFTLLEVVMVVAVLALFIGLAIPRLPDMAGTRIHQNARKVSVIIQLARSRAVSLRRYYSVDMDLDAGDVSVSYFGPEGVYIPDDEVRKVTLRDGMITDVVNSTEGKILEGTGRIRISPRGFIEPSMVHIKDFRDREVTVVPSSASGRVRIREGYAEFAAR